MGDGRVEILKSKLSGQLAVSVDGHRFGPKASPWWVDPKLSWSMRDRALVKAPPSIEALRKFAQEYADGGEESYSAELIAELEAEGEEEIWAQKARDLALLLRAITEVFNPYG